MVGFAVVAGVGAGTGASVARCFAKAYPVALLARSPANYEDLAKEINSSGGKAIGISTDVSDEKSVKSAFEKIQKEFGDVCAAAIFNASGVSTFQQLVRSTNMLRVSGNSPENVHERH